MNLTDKIIKAYMDGKPMPLKGHTKLTLTDQRTGEQKIVESDNMVTNAVADILSKNFTGMANFSNILPLKNLFSGVLCFETALTEDADEFNPPSDDVSSMTACAGDQPHATANPYRGNPNGGESIVTENSVKFVWDWSTNQGNGDIACVCLVPGRAMGNMGLKPFASDVNYNPLSEIGSVDNGTGTTWSEDVAKFYPFNITGDNECVSVYATGTTFKEHTMVHDFTKLGIMRGVNDWYESSSRQATIRSFDNNKSFVFDDSTYYYVAKVTGSTSIQIDRISKTDMTVSTYDKSFSGISLYTGNLAGSVKQCVRIFPFDGTYLYMPTSTSGCVKLNLETPSDVTELTGTVEMAKGQPIATGNIPSFFHDPILINDGLIHGTNYIINGDGIYPIKEPVGAVAYDQYTSRNNYSTIIRSGAACYVQNKETYAAAGKSYQGIILDEMFLSTINNLQSPVTKGSSQTMKIEYTLTEA